MRRPVKTVSQTASSQAPAGSTAAVGSDGVHPKGKVPASSEQMHQLILVAAYFRAERRNFEPGHELDDWLDAEAEVMSRQTAETA
jgi:hypothetical protein